MARYFQYWSGVAVVAVLTLAAPVWLMADDKGLEAAVIGIPAFLFFLWAVSATHRMMRKE